MAAPDEFAIKQNNPTFVGLGSVGALQPSHFDNRRLFQTLVTVVKGPSLQLLLALKGDSQRYTYGIIALWKHAELGASNRRTAAMSAMQAVKFQGDAGPLGSGRCKLWLHHVRSTPLGLPSSTS